MLHYIPYIYGSIMLSTLRRKASVERDKKAYGSMSSIPVKFDERLSANVNSMTSRKDGRKELSSGGCVTAIKKNYNPVPAQLNWKRVGPRVCPSHQSHRPI